MSHLALHDAIQVRIHHHYYHHLIITLTVDFVDVALYLCLCQQLIIHVMFVAALWVNALKTRNIDIINKETLKPTPHHFNSKISNM